MAKSSSRSSKANNSRGNKIGDKLFTGDDIILIKDGNKQALSNGYFLVFNTGRNDTSRKDVREVPDSIGYLGDNKLTQRDVSTTQSRPVNVDGKKSVFVYQDNQNFARLDNKIHSKIKKNFGEVDYYLDSVRGSGAGSVAPIKFGKGGKVLGIVMPMRYSGSTMPDGAIVSNASSQNLPF